MMPVVYDIDGKAMERYDDFAAPHVITFAGIIKGSSNTYLHEKWDEAVKDSPENARMMRNDCWLKALVDERARGTTSSKWELEVDNPADPHQAMVRDGLTRAVQRTPRLKQLLRKQMEALWYGRYGAQLRWKWEVINGERLLCVAGHIPTNGDKIGFQFDGTPYILLNAGQEDQLGKGAEVITTSIYQAILLKGGWRERWLIHKHDPDDMDFFQEQQAAAIHGVGIRSRIYWLDYLRKEFMAWVIEALERTGLGIVLIKYEQGNAAAKAEAETLAKTYSRRSVITMPVPPGTINSRIPGGAYGIEIVETPTAGIEVLRLLWKDIEDKIERYVLGQSASADSETSGMGTHNTEFQQSTKQEIIVDDADELAETLTGSPREPGLLSTMKRWSYPWADFPVRWKFKVSEPSPEKRMKAFSFAAQLGTLLKADEVREVAGASKPGPGDETVGGPQPAPGGGGGFGDDPNPSRSEAAKKGWEKRDRPVNRMAALLNGQQKQFERSGSPLYYESHHAPAGGINLAGKQYVGGEFIPGDQVEKATPAEKKQLKVKRNVIEKVKHAPEAIRDALRPESIEAAADAVLDGAKHPVKTAGKAIGAARAKLKSIYDEYGPAGTAAIVSAYVAYHALAIANPELYPIFGSGVATIQTAAKLVKDGLKKLKSTKEPAL